MLFALVLAAGQSSRMGEQDKLLLEVARVPLLRRIVQAVLDAGIPVGVTLPDPSPERVAVLAGLDVEKIAVQDATKGMGHSIAAGIRGLPNQVSAVMIVPADMPDLTVDDFRLMQSTWTRHPDQVLRAYDGRNPGHPVVFPKRLFPALADLTGDTGARSVLSGETLQKVALPKGHARLDLDRPEDWRKWSEKNQQI